ncbi:unannotated protein [freshwater metagenome]|uniref:Unannotated protein n=1 Tax=freshwater metagenome TaxID=449393 RepID=A0A6J6UI10_9ZZZZ
MPGHVAEERRNLRLRHIKVGCAHGSPRPGAAHVRVIPPNAPDPSAALRPCVGKTPLEILKVGRTAEIVRGQGSSVFVAVEVGVVYSGQHRAAACIDDSRAHQAHVIAIPHIEDLTESSVLHDEEPRADSEGAKVGIENDGGGHGVIVLGKRAHVNAVAVSGRSQFCQHR